MTAELTMPEKDPHEMTCEDLDQAMMVEFFRMTPEQMASLPACGSFKPSSDWACMPKILYELHRRKWCWNVGLKSKGSHNALVWKTNYYPNGWGYSISSPLKSLCRAIIVMTRTKLKKEGRL